jgi:uncharacterized repeat protein (TIGR03803 family)
LVFLLTGGERAYSQEQIVYGFSGVDGEAPHAPGSNGWGVVYRLTRFGAGAWVETLLHTFSIQDGYAGTTGLTFDSAGNLYGTGNGGGAHDAGTVWQLSPSGVNGWHLAVLYNFEGASDGDGPFPAPVFDRAGNLYGTTYNGGDNDGGTVYKLAPAGRGQWNETVLYRFGQDGLGGMDAYNPVSGLVLDAAGILYGTATKGCAQNRNSCNGLGCGCVYKVSP